MTGETVLQDDVGLSTTFGNTCLTFYEFTYPSIEPILLHLLHSEKILSNVCMKTRFNMTQIFISLTC